MKKGRKRNQKQEKKENRWEKKKKEQKKDSPPFFFFPFFWSFHLFLTCFAMCQVDVTLMYTWSYFIGFDMVLRLCVTISIKNPCGNVWKEWLDNVAYLRK
jgi:hypothetical protein